MEIGEEERRIMIEPVEDPVPRPEREPEPEREETPTEPHRNLINNVSTLD